jgi:hypothetical protein
VTKSKENRSLEIRWYKFVLGKPKHERPECRCMKIKINITILWDVVPCSLIGNNILETNSAFIIMVEDADVIEKRIIRHTEKGRLMPRISHPNYSVSLS